MKQHRKHFLFPVLTWMVIVCFCATMTIPADALAQTGLNLPKPGTMVSVTRPYQPAMLTGLTVNPENPLQFEFMINAGDSAFNDHQLQNESTRLIKYFLASLTIPDDQLWVNLAPAEQDRITSKGLGETEMGRDLLEQDYLLKQLTASLMYPEENLGQTFWNRVYEKAKQQYGITTIPTDLFHKVWVVPKNAVVYESGNSAFVIDSHLEVMLDEDYQRSHPAAQKTEDSAQPPAQWTTDMIREIILPEIEREVNEGKNFAPLRQIYHSLILAAWYKMNLKESLLGEVYIDQNKTKGIDLTDKEISRKIYDQYMKAFEQGVYNYVREDVDPVTQQKTPRQYFSGGLVGLDHKDLRVLKGDPAAFSPEDQAMVSRFTAERAQTYQATVNLVDLGQKADWPKINLPDEDAAVISEQEILALLDALKPGGLESAKEEVREKLIIYGESVTQTVFNRYYETPAFADTYRLELINLLARIGGESTVKFFLALVYEYLETPADSMTVPQRFQDSMIIKQILKHLPSMGQREINDNQASIMHVLGWILSLPGQSNYYVVEAAVEAVGALGSHGDTRVMPAMIDLLTSDFMEEMEMEVQVQLQTKIFDTIYAIGTTTTLDLLMKKLDELNPYEKYEIFDAHGSILRYRRGDKAKAEQLAFDHESKGQEQLINPMYQGLQEFITRFQGKLRDQRKYKSIDLNHVRDRRLTAFLKFLKDNGLDDIVVIGGGVRDAFLGRSLNDIDIAVKIPLTPVERKDLLETSAQANERIYEYAFTRLKKLADLLEIDVDRFLPPLDNKQGIFWRGIEIQYAGPIKLVDEQGEVRYLKRSIFDAETKEVFLSITGASLLQMGMDTDGNLYGHTDSLEDLERGVLRIHGDGENFVIGSILRMLRLKHQLKADILDHDYELILTNLEKYKKGELPIVEAIALKAKEIIDKTVEKARDPVFADRELAELGIYDLFGIKSEIPRGLTEEFKRMTLRLSKHLSQRYIFDDKSGPRHAAHLLEKAYRMAVEMGTVYDIDWYVMIAAIVIHDIFAGQAVDHTAEAVKFAQNFLPSVMSAFQMIEVKRLLEFHDLTHDEVIKQLGPDVRIAHQIFFDADQLETFGVKGVYRVLAINTLRKRDQPQETLLQDFKTNLLGNVQRRWQRLKTDVARKMGQDDYTTAEKFYERLRRENYPADSKIGATGVANFIRRFIDDPPDLLASKAKAELQRMPERVVGKARQDYQFTWNFFDQLEQVYSVPSPLNATVDQVQKEYTRLMLGRESLQPLFEAWLKGDKSWGELVLAARRQGFDGMIIKDNKTRPLTDSTFDAYTAPLSDYLEFGYTSHTGIFGNVVMHGGNNGLYLWRETLLGHEFLMFDYGPGVVGKDGRPLSDLRHLWSANPAYNVGDPYRGGGGTRLLPELTYDTKFISVNEGYLHILEKENPGPIPLDDKTFEVTQNNIRLSDLGVSNTEMTGAIVHGFVPFVENTYAGSFTTSAPDDILGNLYTKYGDRKYKGPWQFRPSAQVNSLKAGQQVSIVYYDLQKGEAPTNKEIALVSSQLTLPMVKLTDGTELNAYRADKLIYKGTERAVTGGADFWEGIRELQIQPQEPFTVVYRKDVMQSTRRIFKGVIKETPSAQNEGIFVIESEDTSLSISMTRIKEVEVHNFGQLAPEPTFGEAVLKVGPDKPLGRSSLAPENLETANLLIDQLTARGLKAMIKDPEDARPYLWAYDETALQKLLDQHRNALARWGVPATAAAFVDYIADHYIIDRDVHHVIALAYADPRLENPQRIKGEVNLQLTGQLTIAAGEYAHPFITGRSVKEVIDNLEWRVFKAFNRNHTEKSIQFRELYNSLFTSQGVLRKSVSVLLNGKKVDANDTTALKPDDRIEITDQAVLNTVRDNEVGGIDLNPQLFDLQIKRDGKGIPLPVHQQPLNTIRIEGFLPVIIDFKPVPLMPLILGDAAPKEATAASPKLSLAR